jgi:peptidoglycan/xylan/chitin deacetylase (PgdA/CDA1 family)
MLPFALLDTRGEMIDRVMVKHSAKWIAGTLSALFGPLVHARGVFGVVLNYHRVTAAAVRDPAVDDWNVPPEVFERHISFLAEHATPVRLVDLHERLLEPRVTRPIFAVSFDDGYASLYQSALPVLMKHRIPATVFVVTSAVGHSGPMPFDAWSVKHGAHLPPEATRPLTWTELEACVATDLVDVGSHSHRHRNGRDLGPAALAEEAGVSRELLARRLGERAVPLFAYPYGRTRLAQVGNAYAEAVRAAGYAGAFTTDPGVVTARTPRFLAPRLQAYPLDGPLILGAKLRGRLVGYRIADRLQGWAA